MDIQHYVESILRLEFQRVRVESPRLEPAEIESLAYRAQIHAARPDLFPDPRHTAIALGFKLLPRAPRGLCGEGTAFGVIAFRWDPDPQVRGLRVLHGLAHAILCEETSGSNDADAWMLTGALAVPRTVVDVTFADPDRAAAHVPRWFVEARLST